MDNVYKKYLLIEDTPPLFVPDDASDMERDWWYQYGQFALQQPGYMGIPNLTLEKYREFDSILVQNFGLHISDIASEQLQYILLNIIADPNYLNNPDNLPSILQNLGLSQDTPLDQVTDFLTLFTLIMSGVWLIGLGAAAATGAGYTTIAAILNGTLGVANALDEIDDLISLIQNSEYLIDIIFGGNDTGDAVYQWLQQLLQNLIKPNLNNQDINLSITGNFPVPSAVGGQVYLTQLTDGIPGILYLYTFDPIQGIWILTGTVNPGTQEWWDIVVNPTPGTPPIYNGQGTKGWTPGIPTIGDPTGSNVLNQPLPPFQTDPLGLWIKPLRPPTDNQIQPPPNVNLEHNLPMLPNPYLHLLESEEQPSEIFDIPQYSQSPLEPRGGPGGGIMTYDQLPFHLLQPIDRPEENFYGSFGFNPDDWIFTGIDAEGNQYFIYKTPNYRYYLVYDPSTGEWKQYTKPIRLRNFDDEGNPNAPGSFPPPYGNNVIDTFGEVIYVEYTNEYLKYNPQTGKYEPFNIDPNGVRIYQHPQGHKLIMLPDGRKVFVHVHEYHPLLYDVAGNPRPRPWYATQGLPWWNEPYWTHTTHPPAPLPNNWDTFSGWILDYMKLYGRGFHPLGGQY